MGGVGPNRLLIAINRFNVGTRSVWGDVELRELMSVHCPGPLGSSLSSVSISTVLV